MESRFGRAVLFAFPLLFLLRLKIKTIFSVVLGVAVASLLLSEVGARYFPACQLLSVADPRLGNSPRFAMRVLGVRKGEGSERRLRRAGLLVVLASILLFDSSLMFRRSSLCFLQAALRSSLYSPRDLHRWPSALHVTTCMARSDQFQRLPLASTRLRVLAHQEPGAAVDNGYVRLIALILLLSALSWYLVEQPFRGQRVRFARLGWTASMLAAGLVGFGAWGDLKEGLPFRLPKNITQFVERTTWNENCLFQREDGLPPLPSMECMFNIGSGRTIAVWGDSIASSISPALVEEFKHRTSARCN